MIAASRDLADRARSLGAREVRVVPSGVDLPPEVGAEAEPPEVLYAGRLSPEKGVLELVEAAGDLNLVVAGDGPLRGQIPGAQGFVVHDELQQLYARAAVVACPSRREGFGVACLEAMAHGRPVVATAVGGLLDLVVDGETGIVVPPRDPAALRVGARAPAGRSGAAAQARRCGPRARPRALLLGRSDGCHPRRIRRGCRDNGPVKRALITGIGGQDGSYLAELLLDQGYAVAGVVKPGAAAYENLERVRRTGSS